VKKMAFEDVLRSLKVKGLMQVGGDLQVLGSIGGATTPGNVYYLDNSVTSSGTGISWGTAFKYLEDALTTINANDDGTGAVLFVAPGFYLEEAGLTLSASDVTIYAINPTMDATVFFGSGTQGSVVAATADLLTITGNNNILFGLSLFTYVNTKSAVVFDDTGGANTAGFNLIKNCHFSRQADAGQKYGVYFLGGAYNTIEDCYFTSACADAGIEIYSQVGNTVSTIIRRNVFLGTTYGVEFTAASHNCIIHGNFFMDGSQSGEVMTDCIHASAGAVAGEVLVTDNWTGLAAADLVQNDGAITINEIGNHTA